MSDLRSATGACTAAASLAAARLRHADDVAYLEDGVATNLGEHLDSAGRMAAVLRLKFAIGAGDRVAVIAATSRAYIALWHASLLGHFVIVPLNARLTAAELEPILANAAPLVIVHDQAYDVFAATLAEIVRLPCASIPDLLGAAGEPLATRDDVKPEETSAVIYTTGTTGTPKGAELTQLALARTGLRQHAYWDVTSSGVSLYATTPLFHVSAICNVLGPSLHGNLTVLTPSFDVDRMLEDSRTIKITHLAVVAAMVDRLLDHPEFRAEEHQHLRYLVYGGSPIPRRTIEKMRRLLPKARLVQCYGMTEAAGASTALSWADHLAEGPHLLSCGRALPGVRVVALAPDGTPCAPGQTGEIALRSDGLMRGYWRNPQATAGAFTEGWFHSGDAGYVDDAGYVYVVDRLGDMIITGGENVYSVEVERAIGGLPGIAAVAVIGLPNAQWGEAVHAVVVPETGVLLDSAAVLAALSKRLAGYKCPKTIELHRGPLPTVGNKVNKVRLRQERLGTTTGNNQ